MSTVIENKKKDLKQMTLERNGYLLKTKKKSGLCHFFLLKKEHMQRLKTNRCECHFQIVQFFPSRKYNAAYSGQLGKREE